MGIFDFTKALEKVNANIVPHKHLCNKLETTEYGVSLAADRNCDQFQQIMIN